MVPTVSRAIGPPTLYKNWWLRSPFTDYDNYACLVVPSGDVYDSYDVDYSYGRIIAEHG